MIPREGSNLIKDTFENVIFETKKTARLGSIYSMENNASACVPVDHFLEEAIGLLQSLNGEPEPYLSGPSGSRVRSRIRTGTSPPSNGGGGSLRRRSPGPWPYRIPETISKDW